MTSAEANAAQADMLISDAPVEDLRALCRLLQERVYTLEAHVKVLEMQVELATFAAKLNKSTLEASRG